MFARIFFRFYDYEQRLNKIFYADVVGDYIGIDREEKEKNVFILAEMPQEAIFPCLLSEP